MFWRCILFHSTPLSSALLLLTLLLAKAGAYYGPFQTTNASALATREACSAHWFDHRHTWLTQLQLQS